MLIMMMTQDKHMNSKKYEKEEIFLLSISYMLYFDKYLETIILNIETFVFIIICIHEWDCLVNVWVFNLKNK